MAASGSQTALVDDSPNSLRLDHTTLTLEEDALRVQDTKSKKPRRTCGFGAGAGSGSSSYSILYYHILWAELSPDGTSLALNYVKPVGGGRVEARSVNWTVKLPAATNAILDPKTEPFVARLLDKAYGPQTTRRKRAWVAVNPNAGPGGADKIWANQVKPIFEGAKMPLTVIRTKAAREAIGLAENLDIDEFDIAIACSGDGGPHEIFNGLGRRPDARRALSKIAVCHVPCGSGNALSCNIYGSNDPTISALAIVKGVPTTMDLASVTQGDTRTLSFLSQAYGVMADIDIKTEHLRWMGEARFTLGFLQLVFQKKTYPCDIAYKVEIEGKDAIKAHYRRHQDGANAAVGGDSHSEATSVADGGQGLPPLKYGTSEDKLPEGWEVVPHEKLGYFFCGNMGYMAPELNFFPAAVHNDGLMDLLTMDGDHNPLKMIDLQGKVPKNQFFDSPIVSYRKVSAFRLTPRDVDESGVVSIDGESFPYKTFQVEVHHGLGQTLTRTGKFEAPGPKGWENA